MRATATLRLAVVTAATLVPLVLPAAPAAAHGTRVEAEDGVSTDRWCGDDGPMQAEPGGTGSVMFFPGVACKEQFPGYDPRLAVTSVTYYVDGFTGTFCGQFYFGGSLNGTSTPVCTGPDQWITAPVSLSRMGTGSWTLQWVFASGTPMQWRPNARVDYLTLVDNETRAENEFGTTVEPCYGDNGMRTYAGGTGQVVMFPSAGCAQHFPSWGGRHAVTSVTYWMTGQDTPMCGYFTYTGSVSGRSATRCAASGEVVTVPVTSSSHGTGGYTMTWHNSGGSPNWINAFVDYHDRTRPYAVEAESGLVDETACGGATGGHGVVVFTADGCRVTFSDDNTARVLDSLAVHLDGGSGTLCGRFEVTGGITGTSDQFCGTRWALATARFRTAYAGPGAFSLTWRPSASSPTAHAHLDRFTAVPAIAEAETGAVSSRTCGGDTTTGPAGDGMFFAGNGCEITLQSPGNLAVTSARFRISGVGGTACGYFRIEGAIDGRTDTKCVDLLYGEDTYADIPATTTAVSGGAYTVLWVTSTGTLLTVDATLDRLVLAAP